MSTPQWRQHWRELFSGSRKRLPGEFEQLIDGERDHAEHQMRHDLAGAAHTNEACAELIFETAVDAFDHETQGKPQLLDGCEGGVSG